MDHSGHTFSVRRMQTHDGPGLRTTVFLKGCSLHCAWCHNPEALSPTDEVWWLADKCIGHRACIEICPNDALQLTADGMRIDRATCEGCYQCVEACPAHAMEALRRDWTLDELFDEVRRDAAFYEESGGGVSVSGGEPLAQWRFVRSLFRHCRENGIHTALDTCGEASEEALAAVLPGTRLVLYDLKLIDPDQHKRWTGADNLRILKNLKLVVAEVRRQDDLELWIRTPLIPGATATPENIAGLAHFISEEIEDAVARWELCSFNPLSAPKYRQLGKEWRFEGVPLLTRDEGLALHRIALEKSGFSPERLLLKGRMAEDGVSPL